MAVYRWDRAAGSIEIVYRVVGEGTTALTSWRAGEAMTVVGPLGTGFQLRPTSETVLLLGRGIGTCSLTALAVEAAAAGVSVLAVASGRVAQQRAEQGGEQQAQGHPGGQLQVGNVGKFIGQRVDEHRPCTHPGSACSALTAR